MGGMAAVDQVGPITGLGTKADADQPSMVCGGDCRLGCLERDWRTPEISQSLHEVRWLERRDSNSRPLVTPNTRLKREDERGFAETADGRLKLTAKHKDVCVGATWEAQFPD